MLVTVVEKPDVSKSNSFYTTNRPPLLPNPLVKLPLGCIRPGGWLKVQLELMADGMVGHLDELSDFLKPNNGWLGGEEVSGAEEAPYWLRGFHDLVVLRGDKNLLEESQRWIEAAFASQEGNGYFGPGNLAPVEGEFGEKFTGLWAHAVMLDPIIHHYEYTGDARVIPFMTHFFQYCRDIPDEVFIPDEPIVDKRRPCEMIPHLHWLYNQTGELWLLELATRFFKHFPHTTDQWPGREGMLNAGDNDTMRRYRTDEWLAHHVVDFTHRFRYPGSYYPQSKASWHLAASEYWYNQHMGTWGQQPRGIFGADEVLRSTYTDPRQGCETCAMIEFNKSFYILGRITGHPKYADRCEDITLNHFPASQTPDLKGLHYLTASNQPQLDASGNHEYANKACMISYSPYLYRCCQHNVAMGWPWYVENLWQGTADGGLAAWMYAASEVTAKVGREGREVTIHAETHYPFRDTVHMEVATSQSVEFPLYLRVPKWCKGLCVSLNGKRLDVEAGPQTYLRIEREWIDGDRVDIVMPMELALTDWPRNGSVTVDRGPLSYSIRIEEEWSRCGGTAGWPEWAVLPKSPWNYGLVIDCDKPASSLTVEEKNRLAVQPWTVEGAPVEIKVKAKRIPNWNLENETVEELRPSPIKSDAPEETIRMIPLGCARLRMSCLPTIGEGLDAREWK